jgi:hypothetical protein
VTIGAGIRRTEDGIEVQGYGISFSLEGCDDFDELGVEF